MNDWLHLTDRYGGLLLLKRECVRAMFADSRIEGDGERQRHVHGTTIILDGGGAYFATETAEDVRDLLDVPQ